LHVKKVEQYKNQDVQNELSKVDKLEYHTNTKKTTSIDFHLKPIVFSPFIF